MADIIIIIIVRSPLLPFCRFVSLAVCRLLQLLRAGNRNFAVWKIQWGIGRCLVASLPRLHVGKVISRSVPAKSVAATEVEMISKCAENYLSPGLKNYGMARKKARESLSDGRVNGRKRARKPSTSSSNSTHNNIDSLWIRC